MRLLTCFILGTLGTVQAQQVLYDHSRPSSGDQWLNDQDFPDYQIYSCGMVDDDVFSRPVTITSISIWTNCEDTRWLNGLRVAHVNIFQAAERGPTRFNDPRNGKLVKVSVSFQFWVVPSFRITADHLKIKLSPGRYWIGLMPRGRYRDIGYCGHLAAQDPFSLSPAFWRNPIGGFGLGTPWQAARSIWPGFNDMTLRIEGLSR